MGLKGKPNDASQIAILVLSMVFETRKANHRYQIRADAFFSYPLLILTLAEL
jgi:hypothetical protein